MVEEMVEELDSRVTEMILFLREKVAELKKARKYKQANKLGFLAALLADSIRVLKHYATKEYNPRELFEAYAEFYCIIRETYSMVTDIAGIDKAQDFFDNTRKLAREIVLQAINEKNKVGR